MPELGDFPLVEGAKEAITAIPSWVAHCLWVIAFIVLGYFMWPLIYAFLVGLLEIVVVIIAIAVLIAGFANSDW